MHDIIAGIQTRIFPCFHRLFNYGKRTCRKTIPTTTWQKRRRSTPPPSPRTSNKKIIGENDNFPKKEYSFACCQWLIISFTSKFIIQTPTFFVYNSISAFETWFSVPNSKTTKTKNNRYYFRSNLKQLLNLVLLNGQKRTKNKIIFF